LPVVVGYLVAGVVVGPFTPGFVLDRQSITVLAEIGIAFLMFAVGSEFSLAELRGLGRVGLLGGISQILATMALGPSLIPVLGVSFYQSVFLGALIALSSTVVALKLLTGRGELRSLHGRATLGILIAQDLAVIPLVVILPAVGGETSQGWLRLLIVAAEATALILGSYLLGARVVPWILGHVAVPRSRELFLLAVISLALGTGLVAQAIGLSLAFGAFLAGLVIAESEYRSQVVAEVLPFRDLFTSLFFVSVGMLIDPWAIAAHGAVVALLSGLVVVGKFVIVAVIILLLRLPGRVAVLAGLSLAQVGEFSFVLARVGVDQGAIPHLFLDLILATSLTSIVLAPFTLKAAPLLIHALQRVPLMGRRFVDPVEPSPEAASLPRHAVVCGYGRVGRQLIDALQRRSIPFLVIEYDPDLVAELRSRGAQVIFGDAANPGVMDHAGLDSASLLAALVPDAAATEVIVRRARATNPKLDIVARARDADEVARLLEAGATEVVQPEFEAGVEVIRHALRRYGVGGAELNIAIAGRRRAFYQRRAN
jgi:CPA2 family monovalent cation:H+ antiporter-2